MELASVIIITKNHSSFLKRCLNNLLNQTYDNYEIIIVDDNSNDDTKQLINSFNSDKLNYFLNSENKGLASLRNFGISKSKGNFIFFTDADCIPTSNWIDQGMKLLSNHEFAGVEGKTIVESQNFGISTHFVENINGGQYQTCNIAYKKEYLNKINMFNEKYDLAYEDIDLAIRIKKVSKIAFNENMLVLHQLVPWNFKRLILNSRRAKYKVLLIKEHNYNKILKYRILEINSLFQVIFPFLLPFYFRIRSVRDLYILPLMYLRSVIHRLIIWKTAIIEKIFII